MAMVRLAVRREQQRQEWRTAIVVVPALSTVEADCDCVVKLRPLSWPI